MLVLPCSNTGCILLDLLPISVMFKHCVVLFPYRLLTHFMCSLLRMQFQQRCGMTLCCRPPPWCAAMTYEITALKSQNLSWQC